MLSIRQVNRCRCLVGVLELACLHWYYGGSCSPQGYEGYSQKGVSSHFQFVPYLFLA